ncbi:MAG: efflux RND transporter periplasmic adaptor subunit [Halanaerobiales bacterium]
MNNAKKIFSIFLLFLIAVFFLAGCALFPEEKVSEAPVLKEPPAPRVNVVKVERGYISEEITGLARVAAKNEKSLYFTKSGRVKDVLVDYGDWVEEGQVLARLEVGDLENQLAMARLDLEKMELELERMKFLHGTLVSDYDLRLKEIDYEKAKLQIERLEDILHGSTIYAPFNGRITSLSIRETAMVDEFAEVMVIADPTELELQMNVTQRNLSKIVPGLKAKVQIGQGIWLPAEVTRVPSVSAELAPGQPDLRVRLEIDFDQILAEGNIPPGQGLRYNALLPTAIIIQEKEDALLLPPAAIREYGNRTFVLVKDGDYRREIDVKLGIQTDTKVEILEGLEEGQEIITR